jgi:EEF1A N-terminal glycine/lysine methyltransferase
LFWVTDRHAPLVNSLLLLLERSSSARVLIVAGLHTGRVVMSHFFHTAQLNHLVPDDEGIVEQSVIDGSTRDWQEDRGVEDVVERKQWLIIVKLKWKDLY